MVLPSFVWVGPPCCDRARRSEPLISLVLSSRLTPAPWSRRSHGHVAVLVSPRQYRPGPPPTAADSCLDLNLPFLRGASAPLASYPTGSWATWLARPMLRSLWGGHPRECAKAAALRIQAAISPPREIAATSAKPARVTHHLFRNRQTDYQSLRGGLCRLILKT